MSRLNNYFQSFCCSSFMKTIARALCAGVFVSDAKRVTANERLYTPASKRRHISLKN